MILSFHYSKLLELQNNIIGKLQRA